MPATAAKRTRTLPVPKAPWSDELLAWKIEALHRVRQQLSHLCCGPKAHPKSYALLDSVRHVVAQEMDPESGLGLHLQHMLTGAIAQEITAREELIPQFQAHFPGGLYLPPGFLRKYANSRWWCESVCELDNTTCADILGAVDAAIAHAERGRRVQVL